MKKSVEMCLPLILYHPRFQVAHSVPAV
jgi:hypothetical protein